MAKIARKTQKIFGKDGSLGRFGSAALGSPTVSTAGDLSDMQSLAAYTNGWADAVINGDKRPPLEEFNTLHYINNYQTAYLFQEGIAEYDAGTIYYIDSLVKSSGIIYKSLIDDNLGNALSNLSSWQVMGDLKTSVNMVFIDKKEDFPAAVSNVITLEAKTYIFTTEIDLTGDRLVAVEGTSIVGLSSNLSKIISTGLIGTALITSNYSLTLRFLSIEADIPFNLDASANANQALDWTGVNLVNCANQGTIKTYDNFIGDTMAFLDSAGIIFDGTIGTIAFSNTLFNTASTTKAISLAATLIISRRFRIVYSSFIILSGETGIEVISGVTIPDEGFILDTCNFSGGGTYLDGILTSSNKSRILECRGINNSANLAKYYMISNATDTTIAIAGTYYKILGTTTVGAIIEKFTHSDNRATYVGALSGIYKATVIISAISGNSKELGVKIAKNGTVIDQSISKTTTSAIGKAASFTCQDIISLEPTDYIEVFITNITDTTAITVEDLNVIIERIN